MRSSRLYAPLAYAGALPFVGCAALLAAGVDSLPVFGSVSFIAASYGLAIVSFMSGSLWGTWQHKETADLPLLLFSNALTLASWFSLLLAPVAVTLLVACGCFAFLLALDARLYASQVISREYLELRRNVTGIVIVALLTSAAFAAG